MRRHVFAFSFACMAAASSSISFAQPPEFGPPGGPGGPMGGMMQNTPLMVALDVDGDGQLSKKEISRSAAALNALDKNNDGVVSMDELRPEFGGPRNGPGGEEPGGRGRRSSEAGRNGSSASNAVSKLMAMDKDKDGKVAKSEVDGRLTALFEKADTDKDGFATKEEIEKLARASDENDSRRGGGLGQGGPGPGGPGGFGGGPGGTGMPPGGFGPGGGPSGFGPPNPEEFVNRAFEFDVDGDGKLSKEELSKMFQGNAPGGPGIGGERGGRQRNR